MKFIVNAGCLLNENRDSFRITHYTTFNKSHLFRVHYENGQAHKSQNPQTFHLCWRKTFFLENPQQSGHKIAWNSEETLGESKQRCLLSSADATGRNWTLPAVSAAVAWLVVSERISFPTRAAPEVWNVSTFLRWNKGVRCISVQRICQECQTLLNFSFSTKSENQMKETGNRGEIWWWKLAGNM